MINESAKTKIVVVGGVAGGASAAAKARRVNEHAEIVLFEKGPYVSFANCGLPYYIGGEITDRQSLLLQTPESFWKRFRVQARVLHEVIQIDRGTKKIRVRNLQTSDIFFETYDKLILAPGAGAIVPSIPGINSPNIFTVKTVPDSDAVKKFITTQNPQRAVVVGAGFIGLEAAEVLKRRGLEVSIVELMPQVLPSFDSDVAAFVSHHLQDHGINLILSDGLKAFHGAPLVNEIELQSGQRRPVDLVILSIGVRPELKLAIDAGLTIGQSGGIAVDSYQRTSDPDIFAAGDAVEVTQLVTGQKIRIPLAGPANKQGRVAGANAAGESLTFPGAVGTAIVECMGITAAKTGLSEREAHKAGMAVQVSITHSLDHADYYPGAEILHMKIIADKNTGRLLGAQIVGEKGVDKRIDVIATALAARLQVTDLENLDLAYAPQFSSAKDPVIMAGFVASNIFRDDMSAITFEALQDKIKDKQNIQIVDVRTIKEYQSGHLDDARLIPIDELRDRLNELSPDKETVVYCRVGLRAYLATRILRQHGFKKVLNLTGGILMRPSAAQQPLHSAYQPIDVNALRDQLNTGTALVLDVREPDEYEYEHIERTQNIPLRQLENQLDQLPRNREIFVLCQTGVRTEQAMQVLRSAGFHRAHPVQGGIQAWKSSGLALQRQKGPIPIMRQVQIMAGGMAFLGGAIPHLRWIAIIVGTGLFLAGLSGLCPMATLLSKMPWNRPKSSRPTTDERNKQGRRCCP